MKKVNHPASKRFKEAQKKIDPRKVYSINEAIELASVSLPYGTGKTIKVAVIADNSDQQKAAKGAGADLIGETDLIENIKKGKIDFDILVATPSTMRLLAPVAKILGPKGLMPNPKDGTVTQNIAEAVTNLKKGKINFKNDDSANIHALIGKISFDKEKLIANFSAFLDGVLKAKPSSAKGNYIKNVTLSTSMGPGLKVEFLR